MLKIEKKSIEQICWACDGKGCNVCKQTGLWKETIFYHTYKGKDNKIYCIDGDTAK